jgi:hypothetical protein
MASTENVLSPVVAAQAPAVAEPAAPEQVRHPG